MHRILLALLLAVTQYVNPFTGTDEHGHTFPGATCPFGAVQPSPVTGSHSWKYCSGYQFSDRRILGGKRPPRVTTRCSWTVPGCSPA